MAVGESSAKAWRADAMAYRLAHKEFPDAVVTFDPLSGRTLMLSDLCWFILNELVDARAPRDAATLLQAICAASEEGLTAPAAVMLDEALAHLLDAGLVQTELQ